MSPQNLKKNLTNWDLVSVNPNDKNWDWKILFCFWGINIQSIIGFSLITSLFTSRPKGRSVEVAKDSGTRNENNIFGSLQNTTEPGTPIALNYGLMRVGGQFLSGYILSQQHAQNDAPSIAQIFNSNESPLAAEARAEE